MYVKNNTFCEQSLYCSLLEKLEYLFKKCDDTKITIISTQTLEKQIIYYLHQY